MKRILFATALAAAAALSAVPAHAAQVGVSLGFAAPGAYGRVDIGRFPSPRLVSRAPVIVGARLAVREPVYLWVPAAHRARWSDWCASYGACGVPVYFVEDGWYQQNVISYAPSYPSYPSYQPSYQPSYSPSYSYGYVAPAYAPRPASNYYWTPGYGGYGSYGYGGGYVSYGGRGRDGDHDRDDWHHDRDHDHDHDHGHDDGHPYRPYYPYPPGPPGSHGNGNNGHDGDSNHWRNGQQRGGF